jgi:hypothetical protein
MLNTSIINSLYRDRLKPIAYYPDFLPYNKNQQAYRQHWEALSDTSRGRFFFANGITVKRAGFFRFAFESFKGFLGFTNHCSTPCVQLSLRKLAYFGYVHGYNDASLLTQSQKWHADYQLPSHWYASLVKKRSDKLSNDFQEELLNYYGQHRDYFPQLNDGDDYYAPKPIHVNYYFGQCYTHYDLHQYAANIDPQNDTLIQQLIKKSFDIHFIPPKDSKFYHRYLNLLLNYASNQLLPKATLYRTFNWVKNNINNSDEIAIQAAFRAKELDTTVIQQHSELFIVCYLRKGDFVKASDLLNQVSDENDKAMQHYVSLIKMHYVDIEKIELIDKDSIVGKHYAQSLLKDATGSWWTSTRLATLEKASHFDPSIEEKNPSEFFNYYIKKHKWLKAYRLFKIAEDKHITLNHKNCQILGDELDKLAELEYDKGLTIKSDNWQQAETHYKQSLQLKRFAKHVLDTDDSKHQVNVHLRLYAQLMLTRDIHNQNLTIERLETILDLLNKAKIHIYQHDKQLPKILAKATMHTVYLLRKKCLVTSDDDHLSATKKTKEYCQPYVDKIMPCLDNLIEYSQSVSKKGDEHKRLLADAYFQRAEFAQYFELGRNAALDYQQAVHYAPDNAFYALTSHKNQPDGEIHEKHKELGLSLIRQVGTDVSGYYHWYEERWLPQSEKIWSKEMGDAKDYSLVKQEATTKGISFF